MKRNKKEKFRIEVFPSVDFVRQLWISANRLQFPLDDINKVQIDQMPLVRYSIVDDNNINEVDEPFCPHFLFDVDWLSSSINLRLWLANCHHLLLILSPIDSYLSLKSADYQR